MFSAYFAARGEGRGDGEQPDAARRRVLRAGGAFLAMAVAGGAGAADLPPAAPPEGLGRPTSSSSMATS